jgi:hypothetical protein
MSLPFTPHLAYIGPGAGFAFLGSFLTLVGGLLLGIISVLLWPFRVAWGALAGRQGYRNAKIEKLIFLGLDGLDPSLAERYMAEGKLPNLSRLREMGGFHRLRTTFPAISPVAWSTFATGVNPARHNMFDFLNRNLRSYMPELSSSRVREPERILSIGKYRIPLSRPLVEMRRKSRTFCAFPSPSLPRNSTAACSRQCALLTCSARRELSRSTPRAPSVNHWKGGIDFASKRGADCITAESPGPRIASRLVPAR